MDQNNPSEQFISTDITLTPLVAALQGRDEDEQFLLSSTFLSMDESLQDILVGEKTLALIQQWISEGIFPPTHAAAVAKLIGLAALDDEVSMTVVPSLLEKIGILPENAKRLADDIEALLEPILTERKKLTIIEELGEIPETMPEMPPMTRPSEKGPRPLSPQPPSRNIIDLRKPKGL